LGVLSLSLINNFLFVPPAGQNPDRLVVIHTRSPETAIEKFSYLDYRYYRENNHVFADAAAMPEMASALPRTVALRYLLPHGRCRITTSMS
jgi:hypothetical protein